MSTSASELAVGTFGDSGPGTILVVPASNVLFHVGRSLQIARLLARRGHRVVFAGAKRYLQNPAIIAPGEFGFVELPDFSAEEGMQLIRSPLEMPDRGKIGRLVDAELEVLDAVQPDAVVTDFRPTMCISARVRRVPIVSLLSSHWVRRLQVGRDKPLRTYAISALARRLLGKRLTELLTPPVFAAVIWRKTAPFRAEERARGLPEHRLLWDLLEGDLNLLTDTEGWCPTRALPTGFHRIGPIFWEPDVQLPSWVRRRDPDRPLVLVNYGSTGHRELFLRTYAELGGKPYRVLLATCGQIREDEFPVPDNFHVVKYLPVGLAMELADLVVYHGGAGTAYQAMRGGVPGVVVATHWDQEHAGFATESHGTGVYFALREVMGSPGLLARGCDRVLGALDAHRECLRTLRAELARYDGPALAADHIEALLSRRSRATG